ncbi:uncharacterized protein LOC110430302 isoform X4 [Sorghum bicolor]|uniref:uncharacterized protein LOC110430302 isoform X4 n=1 Tax=Sorghum bicolor TaxID=4558 RepID=UPI000B4250C9|nr:uncharacterized protein LOC110430302 isoform X4 [Sorghum bicolor]|eukprot:XP_021303458.1 uncharacterized protein LOC110430302 isoform X4 [Sorghum bicolor]
MGFRPTKAHRNSTVVIHSTRYSRSLPHRRIAAASGLSGASPVPGGRRCVLSASSLSAPLFAGHVLVLRWISDTGAEKVSLVRCRGAATRSEEDESQSPEIIQMKKERGGSEILMTKIFRWRRVGGGGIYNAGGIQNRQAYVTHDFMREQSGLRKKKKKRGELCTMC